MLLCTKRAQKGNGLSAFLPFTEGVKQSILFQLIDGVILNHPVNIARLCFKIT